MTEFLSEENISLHKEYWRNLKLRLSILEKSVPELKGKALDELYALRISRQIKDEAILIKKEIYLHEVYFSSFLPESKLKNQSVGRVKSEFGSWQNFLFETYMYAKEQKGGFIIVFENKKGLAFTQSDTVYKLPKVILALDLCEHAYFLDYKFQTDSYIKAAISHWDGTKIT